eukprot:CAMPEP_0174951624 /NCGR_PEP_ID=MMETSP1355-20121228/94945_1 /TAXON_ID=464990 /ORGANISM="Hemiselmis tepida, Strain CCMP443" /LENGTH=125 /DNA_ID=CAMNT_0016199289 /DNA_START=233 /DNA_END=609 /DNA_ORIENTATION=-
MPVGGRMPSSCGAENLALAASTITPHRLDKSSISGPARPRRMPGGDPGAMRGTPNSAPSKRVKNALDTTYSCGGVLVPLTPPPSRHQRAVQMPPPATTARNPSSSALNGSPHGPSVRPSSSSVRE